MKLDPAPAEEISNDEDMFKPEGVLKSEGIDEKEADIEISSENVTGEELDPKRVKVKNLPHYFSHKAFKQLLEKNLGVDVVQKIRQTSDLAFVTFKSEQKAQEAVEKINGMVLKKFTLQCEIAEPEPRKGRDLPRAEEARVKTAKESVTPLAEMPYEEQLKRKSRECQKLARRVLNEFHSANVQGMKGVGSHAILNPIVPFISTASYRNKCEFTVGRNLQGKTTVGFVGGRFAKNEHYVLEVNDCLNLSQQTKKVVQEFTAFVEESGLATFNEFTREGTWKMLTVREMSGDLMIIVTVFPINDAEKENIVKKSLIKRFYSPDTIYRGFRCTSLYWQTQANASDQPTREHLDGAPYIYETVMGVRFRVSPDAFFQTNSAAAAVLYSTIGKCCQLCSGATNSVERLINPLTNNAKVANVDVPDEDRDGIPEKKSKVDVEEADEDIIQQMEQEDSSNGKDIDQATNGKPVQSAAEKTIILDICCGTGTIGQCIMKNIDKERAQKTCCIGVELIESAVEDARSNAALNGINEHMCLYVAGRAEDTFKGLRRFVPQGFSLEESRVVGIVDPPRRGIHQKVVVGCRELESMHRLIFVSCDPSAAIKNITDLCRPRSNKFTGAPFKLEKITPVDMFPMTEHFEWVITFVRPELSI